MTRRLRRRRRADEPAKRCLACFLPALVLAACSSGPPNGGSVPLRLIDLYSAGERRGPEAVLSGSSEELTTGVVRQGLASVYRDAILATAPERTQFSLDLPERPWLDLAVGTLEQGAVTFRVEVRERGSSEARVVLRHVVTRPDRWEPVAVDLKRYGGRRVELSLVLESELPGATGLWGTAIVRDGLTGQEAAPLRPRGVVMVLADTLRADHVGWSGYSRETTPFLSSLGEDGVVFENCIAQATWTKVSVPSILTSLYPSTHGVLDERGSLPEAGLTLAEVLQESGAATLGLASIPLVGRATNLQQGFDTFHESATLPFAGTGKTSRDLVDRLLPWLDRHRDDRFFVLLHVADPHSPYRPYPPYDTWWAEEGAEAELDAMERRVEPYLADPTARMHALPTRSQLEAAGIDPGEFVRHELAGYDGSIRGMDAEMRRLVEHLRDLGLESQVLLVFVSDHGEEFLEHGRHFHGHSVYGELSRVPLLLWSPGFLPSGRVVRQTVQTIDVMPTVLDLAGLEAKAPLQGQSLMPLIVDRARTAATAAWRDRPAFTEKPAAETLHKPHEGGHGFRSVAIVDGVWKLIRNQSIPGDRPEYELFRVDSDPLDQMELGSEHPGIVQRLADELRAWEEMARAARLAPDSPAAEALDGESRQQLRALGYL